MVRKKEGTEGRVMGGRKYKCNGGKRTHKVEEGRVFHCLLPTN